MIKIHVISHYRDLETKENCNRNSEWKLKERKNMNSIEDNSEDWLDRQRKQCGLALVLFLEF